VDFGLDTTVVSMSRDEAIALIMELDEIDDRFHTEERLYRYGVGV
jgi:hypothetical protein